MAKKYDKIKAHILLNTSFSDILGILKGKSSAVLFHSFDVVPYYKNQISLSLLKEVLTQIHQNTPLNFGHGIAGIGAVMQWMKNKDILEQGPEELLEEAEILLFKLAYSGKLEKIDIAEGISGLGLYFLQRWESYGRIPEDKAEQFQYNRYKECIIALLLQLGERVNDGWQQQGRVFSYWYGYPGIYLFLQRTHQLQFLKPETGRLLADLEEKILLELKSRPFVWEKTDTYFTLAHFSSSVQIKDLITRDISDLDPDHCPFESTALMAFQLQVIAEKLNLDTASTLSQKLLQKIQHSFQTNGLPDLFPFDPKTNSVPMGFEEGLVGTALPLLSLETGNRSWLEVLGFKNID